jgi:hypothetical protein
MRDPNLLQLVSDTDIEIIPSGIEGICLQLTSSKYYCNWSLVTFYYAASQRLLSYTAATVPETVFKRNYTAIQYLKKLEQTLRRIF